VSPGEPGSVPNKAAGSRAGLQTDNRLAGGRAEPPTDWSKEGSAAEFLVYRQLYATDPPPTEIQDWVRNNDNVKEFAQSDTPAGFTGNYCAKVVYDKDSTFQSAFIWQDVPTVPAGTTVQIDFDFYIVGDDPNDVSVQYGTLDFITPGGVAYITGFNFGDPNDPNGPYPRNQWHHFSHSYQLQFPVELGRIRFNTPQDEVLPITDRTIYLDQVSIVRTDTSEQIVSNGGFEQLIPPDPPVGDAYAVVECAEGSWFDGGIAHANFDVSAYQGQTLVIEQRLRDPNNRLDFISFGIWEASPNQFNGLLRVNHHTTHGMWFYPDPVTWTVPAGAQTAHIKYSLTATGGATQFRLAHIDDVKVYPQGDPNTNLLTNGDMEEPSIRWECNDPNRETFHFDADLDQDCHVNWGDFSIFAGQWLWCTDPNNPDCDQYWWN